MTQSPSLPELPKLPAAREFYGHDYVGDKIHAGMGFIDEDMQAYATAHGLACYEAGRAAAAQAAWQPISMAPKDGTHVLTWWASGVRIGWVEGAGKARDGGDWWMTHERLVVRPTVGRPTHWMPLPAPPTQGAEGAAPQAVVGASESALGPLDQLP